MVIMMMTAFPIVPALGERFEVTYPRHRLLGKQGTVVEVLESIHVIYGCMDESGEERVQFLCGDIKVIE